MHRKLTTVAVVTALLLLTVLLLSACGSGSTTTSASTGSSVTTATTAATGSTETTATTTATSSSETTATTAVATPSINWAPVPYTAHVGTMPDTLPIGTLQAMTGYGAYYGKVETEGINLAFDEINATKEFPFQLKLIVGDHKTEDSQAALSAVQKMIDIDHVPWVLSSWVSNTLAVAPVLYKAGVVQLNAGGIGTSLIGVNALHNSRLDSSQVIPSLMKYMAGKFAMKKIALTYWADATGKGSGKIAEGVAKDLGVDVVFSEPHATDQTDFRSLIAKIKSTNPDVIGLWSFDVTVGDFLKQLREAGVTVPVVGIDMNPNIQKIAAGKLANYFYGGDNFGPYVTTKWAEQFRTAYSARYGIPAKDVDQYAANYYEASYIIRDTIRYLLAHGGDPFDGKQMGTALMEAGPFNTLLSDTGKVTLLPNGMAVKPCLIIESDKDGNSTMISTDDNPKQFIAQ